MDPQAAKQLLRTRAWQAIRDSGAARFPGVEGRIPNFVGAEAAAARAMELPVLRAAARVKCNPDSPQRPLRHRLLQAGVTVIVPAPRLAGDVAFLELDPADLGPRALWAASSIKGAAELGRPLRLAEVGPLDAIVTGCVGAGADGARLGKGGGYSDLEFALLRELGVIEDDISILTTVHPCQVLYAGAIPVCPHDQSLDFVVTPERVLTTARTLARPSGVLWSALSAEQIAAMPVLARREPR